MRPQQILDLRRAAQHRVERAHRALRHQRDAGEAGGVQRRIRRMQQVHAIEPGLATEDAARGPQQPHQRERGGGLARAALAHQSDPLAGMQREGDVPHRARHALPRRESDLEIAHREHRPPRRVARAHASTRTRALSSRSIPAEAASSAQKISAMAATGGTHHHHMPRSTAS